jgi:hypothetical protein
VNYEEEEEEEVEEKSETIIPTKNTYKKILFTVY